MSCTERKDVVDKDDRTQIVNFIPHGMESENQNEMAEYEVFQKMNYYRKWMKPPYFQIIPNWRRSILIESYLEIYEKLSMKLFW